MSVMSREDPNDLQSSESQATYLLGPIRQESVGFGGYGKTMKHY